MKTCTTCLAEKPLDEFHNNKNEPSGKTYGCKPCNNARARQWGNENKERMQAASRTWRLANRDELLESKRAYQLANRDKLAARQREYRHPNPGAVKEAKSRYKKRVNGETQTLATKAPRTPWEAWEEAAIMDYSKTSREWALELGRTYSSVQSRREYLTKRFINTN